MGKHANAPGVEVQGSLLADVSFYGKRAFCHCHRWQVFGLVKHDVIAPVATVSCAVSLIRASDRVVV
jgi:hypothetical protein